MTTFQMERRLHYAGRLFLIAAVWMLGASCRHSSNGTTSEDLAAVPSDFHMVFGQGGGFTGRWTGYTIEADGRLSTWEGPIAAEHPQPAGTLSPEQLSTLWQQIQDAGFFDMDVQDVGNMTAMMEITANGQTHRLSWIPRVEGLEPLDTPHEKLYVFGRTLSQKATNGNR